MPKSLTYACISCASSRTVPVLSLGNTPLANALLSGAQLGAEEPRFPLDLVFCEDCALVQITERVPPEQLFAEYPYFSSFSDTMVAAAKELSRRIARASCLGPKSLVMEIASNDGYLLQHYVAAGIPVLGIEPARNIARVADRRGIRTRSEFFGLDLARRLKDEGLSADVVHANNVLAHVPDLNGFVEGLAVVLKPGGVAVIEVPYVRDLVARCEFDTIYHEHLCYFSVSALHSLFARHGLDLVDIERISVHGGSLRVFASRSGGTGASVKRLLEEEHASGVNRLAYYAGFAEAVSGLRADLLALLRSLKGDGKRIAAYGASAKGSTLLNFFGIGSESLDYVVDRSTEKQGKFTPGTKLPIHSPEKLRQDKPDYLLLLAWNHLEEVLAQQAAYRAAGGKFIVPVPEVQII